MKRQQDANEGDVQTRPDVLRGAVAGLAAGLLGSLAMDLAQKALAKLQSSEGQGGGEPSTEQAADRLAHATTGAPVPDASKAPAGQAVHYGFGALLGLSYGIAAEYLPESTAGMGSAFGVGTALVFDEAAVPMAGLGKPPWDALASTHLYTLASHLVFGTVAEGTRRLIRSAF